MSEDLFGKLKDTKTHVNESLKGFSSIYEKEKSILLNSIKDKARIYFELLVNSLGDDIKDESNSYFKEQIYKTRNNSIEAELLPLENNGIKLEFYNINTKKEIVQLSMFEENEEGELLEPTDSDYNSNLMIVYRNNQIELFKSSNLINEELELIHENFEYETDVITNQIISYYDSQLEIPQKTEFRMIKKFVKLEVNENLFYEFVYDKEEIEYSDNVEELYKKKDELIDYNNIILERTNTDYRKHTGIDTEFDGCIYDYEVFSSDLFLKSVIIEEITKEDERIVQKIEEDDYIIFPGKIKVEDLEDFNNTERFEWYKFSIFKDFNNVFYYVNHKKREALIKYWNNDLVFDQKYKRRKEFFEIREFLELKFLEHLVMDIGYDLEKTPHLKEKLSLYYITNESKTKKLIVRFFTEPEFSLFDKSN